MPRAMVAPNTEFEALRALASNCEITDRAVIRAALEAVTPAQWLSGEPQQVFFDAANSENKRFLDEAFRCVHWNYWPSLHTLMTILLDHEPESRQSHFYNISTVFYAMRRKNVLLQVYRLGIAHDCGQFDHPGRVTEGGAVLEQRLKHDSELALSLFERIRTLYPRLYHDFGQSSTRVIFSPGGAINIETRTFWPEGGPRMPFPDTVPNNGPDCVYAEPVRGYVVPPPQDEAVVAFFRTVRLDDVSAVCALLGERPGLANERDDDERTPLHVARSALMVDALCAAGASTEAVDRAGFTPLLHATMVFGDESPSIITALLRHGANTMASDNDGRTCVHWAAMAIGDVKRALEVLSMLQARNAAKFAFLACSLNKFGENALHLCLNVSDSLASDDSEMISSTRRAIVQMLVLAGVSPDVPDKKGKTPRQRATLTAILANLESTH